MNTIEKMVREHIRTIKPYSSARDEFSGKAKAWLDANENGLNSVFDGNFARYPDPHQIELKKALARYRNVDPSQIFIGNGSDEAIDLLMRVFCEPGQDKIAYITPSYGMYKVSATINQLERIEIPLSHDFDLPEPAQILEQINGKCKILILCSPNNPSGNTLNSEKIIQLIEGFKGLVVLDEAYIDFCPQESKLPLLLNFANLIVLQTFSKAFGLAALRIGVAYANKTVIQYLNRIKPPYNVSAYAQKKALEALAQTEKIEADCLKIIELREKLVLELKKISSIYNIFPSQSNFILIQCHNSDALFESLLNEGIIIRNRNKEIKDALRITVGNELENNKLIELIKQFI